jgi:glucosamine-6-phosphate deaminase
MTIRRMLASTRIICSVPDARKAVAVQAAVEGAVIPVIPASILQTHDACTLHLDRAAAARLTRSST